tara:strand:- start:837 stop:989 length:153 start_codon:yes stop_codon:yes gene_type:complete
MPTLEDPDGQKQGNQKMKKVPKEKNEEACNHSKKGVDCPVHGMKACSKEY